MSGKIKKVEKLKVLTCGNKKCVEYKTNREINTKCCSECGTKTSIKNYDKTFNYDASEYIFESDESSVFENELLSYDSLPGTILIPNQYWRKKDVMFDSYESGIIELKDTDSKNAIEWATKKYEKQILILKKAFGDEAVKIKFGLISYCN